MELGDFCDRIYDIFDEMKDEPDFDFIFKINDENIYLKNYVVCFNLYDEYMKHHTIYIYSHLEEEYSLMIQIRITNSKLVTTFYNCVTQTGLQEICFDPGTYLQTDAITYRIDDKKVDENDDRIAKTVQQNTQKIFAHKTYPELLRFIERIMHDNEKRICVIPLSEFVCWK